MRKVDNRLAVATLEAADEIRDGINAAMRRRLGRDVVTATFDDGVVTLSGTVSSWLEQSAAEETARRSPGVRKVVDRITIEP